MKRVIMSVLFLFTVIAGCATTDTIKENVQPSVSNPAGETPASKEEFDYEAYKKEIAARAAAATAERTAFNATLSPSPEGMHTWVLQSVDMVTCGREGISMYCVETNVEPDGFSFTCSDEDAERILMWFGWKEDDGERRDWRRVVDKPFHIPVDVQTPSGALDYLLKLIRHNGVYERPSADDVRSKLVEAFAALEIPNIYDDSVDAERWQQVLKPLFWANLPKDVKDWGMPATTNEAFLAFQRDVRTLGDISVSIVFQSWGRESSDYFVRLQNERGAEQAALIDRWSGDLKRCRIANGTILEIDWDFYRSEDDEPQYGGGR